MESMDLENLVSEMYTCAGLSDKDDLDFDDFKKLLTSKDQDFIDKVGVDWKGGRIYTPILVVYAQLSNTVINILLAKS
mgnify:CR=1 FL=1